MQKRAPILVTTLIAGAFFMENLDGTIIATALPQMARSFHIGAVNLNIGMTAYLLTLAVFIPISGWVADRFGARSVFASAIGIFTLASVLCGLSHTLTQFTLLRILQGIGGAMMVPVAASSSCAPRPRTSSRRPSPTSPGPASPRSSWARPSAASSPPTPAGTGSSSSTCRSASSALVLTVLWVENISKTPPPNPLRLDHLPLRRHRLHRHRLCDREARPLGSTGTSPPPSSPSVSSAASSPSSRPPPAPLPHRSRIAEAEDLRLSIYGASGFRIAVSVLPFLLPLMFQIGFGLSAFASGMYLLALFAGDLSMKAIVIPVLRRFGFRRILIVNGVITASSIALCATFSPATPPPSSSPCSSSTEHAAHSSSPA